jgi:hypothetical protein
MKRDKKGRFTSEVDDNKGYKFTLTFPSVKNLIFWVFILILVSPWAIILERSNILQKLLEFLENILIQKEESETSKKNGLFY